MDPRTLITVMKIIRINASEVLSAHVHVGHLLSCQSVARVNQILALGISLMLVLGISLVTIASFLVNCH